MSSKATEFDAAMAELRNEVNRGEKADAYYDIPVTLQKVSLLSERTMTGDSGNIELKYGVRWSVLLDGETLTIDTYTLACRHAAELFINRLSPSGDFTATPISIVFFAQQTKQHKKAGDGRTNPAVKIL